MSRENFANYAHTGPHCAPTRQILCAPHGFKDSSAKRKGLVMQSIAENLLDRSAVKQQLGQSLPAELQSGPVKQTCCASLPRCTTLLMPSQPSDQTRQP